MSAVQSSLKSGKQEYIQAKLLSLILVSVSRCFESSTDWKHDQYQLIVTTRIIKDTDYQLFRCISLCIHTASPEQGNQIYSLAKLKFLVITYFPSFLTKIKGNLQTGIMKFTAAFFSGTFIIMQKKARKNMYDKKQTSAWCISHA